MDIFDDDMIEISTPPSPSGVFWDKDGDAPKTDWYSIKDAFLKIVSSESGPFSSVPDQGYRRSGRVLYGKFVIEDGDDLRIGNICQRIENDLCLSNIEGTSAVESNNTAMDLGSTTKDIFRVWDLEIPDVLDDLTIQLGTAFVDFPPLVQPNPDSSTTCKDDLVVGVSNLSLNGN
ncbi:hypothetical protein vseg_018686 [Gypsophila vaccaria]